MSLKPAHIKVAGLGVALLALLADQASKWAFLLYWLPSPQDRIAVFTGFDLVHAWNYGVSFSLFAHADESRRYALIGLTMLITIAVLVMLLRSKNLWSAVAYGLIAGGAVGNIIDRVVHGAVYDFLLFYIGDYAWPAFNLADSFIFIGVVALLWEAWHHPATPQSKQVDNKS